MIKHRKRSLFKNDFSGIKQKMLMWRVTNHREKLNHLRAYQLECLLNMAMLIGIPRTEEEAVKLGKVYNAYYHLVNEIESNMNRVYDKIYDWRND